jgi:hypothetical protein
LALLEVPVVVVVVSGALVLVVLVRQGKVSQVVLVVLRSA